MKKRYLVKFYYDEVHSVTLPVKAESPEEISDKIMTAYENKNIWISFPTKDKYSGISGSERITVNLNKVNFFKVENPTKLYLERYSDEDFIDWEGPFSS
ncbi:hypothetical protein [Neobacillus sp. PS3-40]|uniref:hypothetical protein n=1 Tax=Neobacillus sp. PS3-40 TaxID=3070679 RepID=UPI0027E006C3|nr:hypothetical protein [Neobacillus sp. PS3-40]WML44466.1 hypothetical protein RCG20_00690 [Neobacillus sp. PS3-40]